jgi:hypothetical protein
MTIRIRDITKFLIIPDIPNVRAPLKALTFRLSSTQRTKLQYLAAVRGIDESQLVRDAIEFLFHENAEMLAKRFSPEMIFGEFERRLDRVTLAELTPELLTLNPNNHSPTRRKILEVFKRRVAELAVQHSPSLQLSSPFQLSWGETTHAAAERLIQETGTKAESPLRGMKGAQKKPVPFT